MQGRGPSIGVRVGGAHTALTSDMSQSEIAKQKKIEMHCLTNPFLREQSEHVNHLAGVDRLDELTALLDILLLALNVPGSTLGLRLSGSV